MSPRDDSDPPSHGETTSALSGLFPRAPTLDALFDSSRKQASQLIAVLGANRESVRRDRDLKEALRKLEERIGYDVAQLKTANESAKEAIDGIGKSFSEFQLELAKAAIPEAEKKGANNTRIALLMAGAAVLGAGLLSLLWHFIGKVTP